MENRGQGHGTNVEKKEDHKMGKEKLSLSLSILSHDWDIKGFYFCVI